MTTVAYPGLTAAENIFKSLVWDNEVDAAIAALFVAVPWLNFWPLAPIIAYLIKKFTDTLFSGVVLIIDVTAIRLVNLEHQRAYDSESVQLRLLADKVGGDSDEFKKARENAKMALSKYARFGAVS